MTETLQNIINTIGASNVLAISLFLLSLLVAFYLYFRTFYRLVYSTGRNCKRCNNITDWTNNETEFTTRILFYNNGRKTITRKEIQKLEIISSNKINSVKTIKGNATIKTKTNEKQNSINVDIENLDSSEFFVLEIIHKGKLDINGRISETGNLLHTEPKVWTILNFVFLILFLVMICYNLAIVKDKENIFTLEFIANFFISFGIFGVISFIHSILFIPDSLSSKYLDTKDKFAREFKN